MRHSIPVAAVITMALLTLGVQTKYQGGVAAVQLLPSQNAMFILLQDSERRNESFQPDVRGRSGQ
jgi:hypothetical protein